MPIASHLISEVFSRAFRSGFAYFLYGEDENKPQVRQLGSWLFGLSLVTGAQWFNEHPTMPQSDAGTDAFPFLVPITIN